MSREFFEVTEQHLALLRRLRVADWDDDPAINSKRPYGNSFVLQDLAKILDPSFEGIEDDDAIEAYLEENEDRLWRIHREVSSALEIALRTGEFKAGRYSRSRYGSDWERVEGEAG